MHVVKLKSLLSRHAESQTPAYLSLFLIGVCLAVIEFVLEWLAPRKQTRCFNDKECPYNYADIFSVLSFSWITPLMRSGYKHYLTQDDLWDLRDEDTTNVTAEAFKKAWQKETKRGRPSLWIALFRGFGWPYFEGALIKCCSDILTFLQPQLLRLLIHFIDSYRRPNPEPYVQGITIALAMFATSILQTICLHQYFRHAFETGMRVKTGLTAAIYTKSLRLSNEGRATKSTGDIVNYMAVDTQRLHDLAQYGQHLWSAPFQIILCMLSLYQLLGFSMFAGIGIMVRFYCPS